MIWQRASQDRKPPQQPLANCGLLAPRGGGSLTCQLVTTVEAYEVRSCRAHALAIAPRLKVAPVAREEVSASKSCCGGVNPVGSG